MIREDSKDPPEIKEDANVKIKRLDVEYLQNNELIFNLWDKDRLIDDNMLSFIVILPNSKTEFPSKL